MTKEDFFEELSSLARPGDFLLTSAGAVRSKAEVEGWGACPICWLASKKGLNPSEFVAMWHPMGQALGLPEEDAGCIARAADNQPAAALRQDLLKACKLA